MITPENTSAPAYNAVDVARLFLPPTAELNVGSFAYSPSPAPGFVTFYDPGWSILRLRAEVTNKGTIFFPQSWYNTEPFAELKEAPCYRQLRMTAVPASFGRTFAEQQALLTIDEEVPTARVVVMGMVLHFLATGERLLPVYCVRCSDTDSDGYRVYVGSFGSDGLRVFDSWDDDRYSSLGLSASRKF